MCKKLFAVLALSLFLTSMAAADTVVWDFEDGSRFDLWSAKAPGFAFPDPETAGDESLTGVGGFQGLPEYGIAWTVGLLNEFDGLKPAVVEGCHVNADGRLEYGPCNDPFGDLIGNGWLNTYALSQWGDNLHVAANDQIATSNPVILDANAVLTVWSQGGGSGTHAPEYAANVDDLYTDGSSGIAVLDATDYSLLAAVHCNGKGDLEEVSLDLSDHAGKLVLIEVVDAFDGGWGWLCVDKIEITNAISKLAGIVVQMQDGEVNMGFDPVQIERLGSKGYTVEVIEQTTISDGEYTAEDANMLDVLVVSESIGSGSADPLIPTSAPTMHQEAYGWDNWNLVGPLSGIHGWQTFSDLDVVNDTHEIMVNAGLSIGSMTYHDPEMAATLELVSNLAPGAELLGQVTITGDTAEDYAVVFAIEAGGELFDGSLAPNRRAGFSLSGAGELTADMLTDETWAWYDATVKWLDDADAEEEAVE